MSPRTFARIYGIVFLLVGIAGFIPGINQPHTGDHGLRVTDPGHGMLLGLFHVNVLHNIVHLLFGVWGLIASRSFPGAKMYAQVVGVIYIVLACLAFVSPSTFGLIPIGGHDRWLHALFGLALAYFGFTAKPEAAPAAV